MTDSAKRRVVQGYRRRGEAAALDNPFPTVTSGAKAIELRLSAEKRASGEALSPVEAARDAMAVEAWKSKTFGGQGLDYATPFPKEQLWTVRPGDPSDPRSEAVIDSPAVRSTARGDVGENRSAVRPGYDSIYHTHPDWARPQPGPEDSRYAVPVYGFTPSGVWVLRPGANRPEVLGGNPFW